MFPEHVKPLMFSLFSILLSTSSLLMMPRNFFRAPSLALLMLHDPALSFFISFYFNIFVFRFSIKLNFLD